MNLYLYIVFVIIKIFVSSVTINCSDSMEPFYLFENMDDFIDRQNDFEDGMHFEKIIFNYISTNII